MKKIEASGRTTDEALSAAAQQLGVSVDDLEYEILEEGSKGFLGLGQTPTSVKAWVGESARKGKPKPEPKAVEIPEKKPEPTEQPPEPPAEAVPEPQPEGESEGSEAEPGPAARDQGDLDSAMSGDPQEIAKDLTKLLGEVLEAMRLDAKPELKSVDSEEITIELCGKDVAILIGKQGQTLDALQYLAGIAATKSSNLRLRVILDAEGYRERHKEMLHRRALEYAKAVVEAGEEAVLEPQSARDRRIVHLALADHPDVYTYSEGVGDDRHVVISPRK